LRLETNPGLAWVNGVSNLFGSDQESETYAWLGQSPAMREWLGGRQAKNLRQTSQVIRNLHYEATLEIARRDLRRDKTGQIIARVNEYADRAVSHWASLLHTLIEAGESTACYDAQYYFDTDHSEGASGSQSNDLSVDISALPCQVHGSTTVPSIEEMQQCIMQAIVAIMAFKDDQGEPMNENASSFMVLTPPATYLIAQAAVSAQSLTAIAQNLVPSLPANMRIDVQMNARSTWTTKIGVWRTDSPIKGLIRQQETPVELKAKAEGSEFEFDNDAWQFGIDSWRNVGYGFWQRACLVTMA
jgi:phage major head subunit gpT-like protein